MARHASSAFTVRQYMLAKDFELYYYNDNDLRSVDMHRHDYLECYFFLEGKVEMIVGGQKCQPTPGDVLIVLPGTDGMRVYLRSCQTIRTAAAAFPPGSLSPAFRPSFRSA